MLGNEPDTPIAEQVMSTPRVKTGRPPQTIDALTGRLVVGIGIERDLVGRVARGIAVIIPARRQRSRAPINPDGCILIASFRHE